MACFLHAYRPLGSHCQCRLVKQQENDQTLECGLVGLVKGPESGPLMIPKEEVSGLGDELVGESIRGNECSANGNRKGRAQ